MRDGDGNAGGAAAGAGAGTDEGASGRVHAKAGRAARNGGPLPTERAAGVVRYRPRLGQQQGQQHGLDQREVNFDSDSAHRSDGALHNSDA